MRPKALCVQLPLRLTPRSNRTCLRFHMWKGLAKFVAVTLICVVALVVAAARQPNLDDGALVVSVLVPTDEVHLATLFRNPDIQLAVIAFTCMLVTCAVHNSHLLPSCKFKRCKHGF